MKYICYTIQSGNDVLEKTIPYTEANMEIAKTESVGDVTVEDYEMQESIDQNEVMIDLLADHEYRLCILELGGDV